MLSLVVTLNYSVGKQFQMCGAATENALVPIVRLILGTSDEKVSIDDARRFDRGRRLATRS